MQNLQSNNIKYEKIKLFFLSFIAIFLLALSILCGTILAYRDYSQELKQNNNNSQIVNNKDLEVKKADIVQPFTIEESFSKVYMGSSHNRSFLLSYTSSFDINSIADITGCAFDLTLYEYNISNFSYNIIFQQILSFDFDTGEYSTLPNLAFNVYYEYSFYFVQYQNTGNYTLRGNVYFEDIEPSYPDDEELIYSFTHDTGLIELNPDLRPMDMQTYSFVSSFDYLPKFSSIVFDNAYGIGYSQGFRDGEEVGYDKGLIDGELIGNGGTTTNNAFSYIWSMISNATNSVLNIFNFNILPGLPLYAVIAVPIIISILFFVLKVVKK